MKITFKFASLLLRAIYVGDYSHYFISRIETIKFNKYAYLFAIPKINLLEILLLSPAVIKKNFRV